MHKNTTYVTKKLLKLHRKESNNWPMVSLIHNGSEIATWMGHNFKKKKDKIQSNIFKIATSFFEFQAADH